MKIVKYTRKDIVRRVSNNLGLSDKVVKFVLEQILKTMTDIFMENHKILRLELRNFGVFEVKPTKAKPRARNPRKNIEIFVPAHKKICFRAGKILKFTVIQI